MEGSTKNFRVAVVGDKGVGKTTLIYQYLLDNWMTERKTAKGRIFQTTVTIDSTLIDVDIIDSEMDLAELAECNAFVLVFSTASRATFNFITSFKDHLPALPQQGRLIVLVGTQTDVDHSEVDYEHGLDLAKAMKAGYFQTSYQNRDKVDNVFSYLLRRHLCPPETWTTSETPQLRESTSLPFHLLKWIWVNIFCGGRWKSKSRVGYD
ncbi:uncharacterized protein A1O5_03920 [Cladophialophora psammophila CBS 110553]|uniref:Ras family, other n=1 Tax=Cladophialophora psammophila CBS 110553 TaxID=1182543 RepID=W9WXT1_9EURO|nr:uncharacterized protein A1O5_03920 [Cladophialophora psammophila CBS 110553]EXJ72773.1 hypothetical protein A1O5_03920 [Cladophialophora psammophila CBS 110553]